MAHFPNLPIPFRQGETISDRNRLRFPADPIDSQLQLNHPTESPENRRCNPHGFAEIPGQSVHELKMIVGFSMGHGLSWLPLALYPKCWHRAAFLAASFEV